MTQLDSSSKEALRKTIRALRERLIKQLTSAADGAYQLSVKLEKAKLPEAARIRRERLEVWLAEQERADGRKRDEHLQDAVKEAAHTLLNRLVVLHILEHHGLSEPAVVTGGLKSAGYREFAEFAQALVTSDDTRGYQLLLELVFDELAVDLPGMFGPVGLSQLFPIPAATLRETVEALNDPALEPAWGDDTTLGWVYQFWNDPERERLDAKINDGKKIAPHEIASKTQMFTERYMVEWLLQNSLGQTWLAMCKKHGWTPGFEAVREGLEARRADWRKQREAGEVAPDALMPIESELEDHWKYWVEQPLSDTAVEAAPDKLADLKLLDPACGSGHFLVIAFDLLAALYREEAQHCGVAVSDEEIATSIIENNLHGVDIDPRAVQIAAAALWLKAKLFAAKARVARMNLVAPCFTLSNLAAQDPARARFETDLERQGGISTELTGRLIGCLASVDHLGTLFRVDRAVERMLEEHDHGATNLLLDKVASFLNAHSKEPDLGLRLEGEEMHSGVRFIRLNREQRYDVVVGNPPYLGTQKTVGLDPLDAAYPRSKEDLYAIFLERSLELAKPFGRVALVTMRSWMFVSHFLEFRQWLLADYQLAVLADLGSESFAASQSVEVAMTVLQKGQTALSTVAIDANAARGVDEKAAVLSASTPRYRADAQLFLEVRGCPVVYRWEESFLREFVKRPLLGDVAPVRVGMKTSNNLRFVRTPAELEATAVSKVPVDEALGELEGWVPYIKGASGKVWLEPLSDAVNWTRHGLEIRLALQAKYKQGPQCESLYFQPGVAYSTIGTAFVARKHRYRSIFDVGGSSVFPENCDEVVCLLNSQRSRDIVSTLNPTINFQVGDIARVPLLEVPQAEELLRTLGDAFSIHESHREPSVEFKRPGPSPWATAQRWAQGIVDSLEQPAPVPYQAEFDPPEPVAHMSFALGVALGRFDEDGKGILTEPPQTALPHGMLFIANGVMVEDSLSHPAVEPIRQAWQEHGTALKSSDASVREFLRDQYFAYHRTLYQKRPIYFPLSSANKNFVAYISIHRWTPQTLQTLLAEHLLRAREVLRGHKNDLEAARASAAKAATRALEERYRKSSQLLDELEAFITNVQTCAEKGPPPTDSKCPAREVDAPFRMDLDDGVMINSAALWPLLTPYWKDPKTWWKELCVAKGRKDHDWSKLSARYFPKRVDQKCRQDASLSVTHHCFWMYHPQKAYEWELRLQERAGDDFSIDEAAQTDPLKQSQGSEYYRAQFVENAAEVVDTIRSRELQRRRRTNKEAAAGPGLRRARSVPEPQSKKATA